MARTAIPPVWRVQDPNHAPLGVTAWVFAGMRLIRCKVPGKPAKWRLIKAGAEKAEHFKTLKAALDASAR